MIQGKNEVQQLNKTLPRQPIIEQNILNKELIPINFGFSQSIQEGLSSALATSDHIIPSLSSGKITWRPITTLPSSTVKFMSNHQENLS